MLILKILLLIIILVVLFVLFLRHKLEFVFDTPKFWEISYSNMFLKYSNGTNGGKFDFFIKFKTKKEKPDNPELFEETNSESKVIKPAKPVEIREEQRIEPKQKNPEKEKKEKTPKPVKSKKKSKKTEDIDDFLDEDLEISQKTLQDWIESAKKLWKKEEKFVIAILKYCLRAIKLSMKLLTPSKINLSLQGGFDDPAETGWLYSSFILFNDFFEKNKRVSLNFTPQFAVDNSVPSPEWKANVNIIYSFSIADLLLFAFLILITFPYIQTLKFWLRNRKYFKSDN